MLWLLVKSTNPCLSHIAHHWGQQRTITLVPLSSGISCCYWEVAGHSDSWSFEQRLFHPSRDTVRVFSLFTVSGNSKWVVSPGADLFKSTRKFSDTISQAFQLHFLYSLFLEFLLGECCWPSWTSPLIFLSVLSCWPSPVFCSSFWEIFPLYHLSNLLFLALLFLTSKNSPFFFFDHSWIKASSFWLMGAALPLFSLRILNLCLVYVWEVLLFPCFVSVSS